MPVHIFSERFDLWHDLWSSEMSLANDVQLGLYLTWRVCIHTHTHIRHASTNHLAEKFRGRIVSQRCSSSAYLPLVNPLNPELNPICYLLALLGAHHFLHVSRIRVKSLTFRLLMSHTHTHIYIYIYIYGAPILDVSRSHTTTQHSR